MPTVHVFWDMVTCPPSTREQLSLVVREIRHVFGNFQIFGPILIAAYGIKTNIPAAVQNEIGKFDIRMTWLREDEEDKGVLDFKHQIIALKFDQRELEKSASQPPAKVMCMLISIDEMFAGLLHKLKWQSDYQTILVHLEDEPRKLQNSTLVCSCDFVWSFAGLLNRAGPC